MNNASVRIWHRFRYAGTLDCLSKSLNSLHLCSEKFWLATSQQSRILHQQNAKGRDMFCRQGGNKMSLLSQEERKLLPWWRNTIKSLIFQDNSTTANLGISATWETLKCSSLVILLVFLLAYVLGSLFFLCLLVSQEVYRQKKVIANV